MTTYTNQNKNTTSITDVTKSTGSSTWAEHTETWTQATGETWTTTAITSLKDTTVLTNVQKS